MPRAAKPFGAVWLFILLCGGMQGEDLPNATAQHGAFAFPDPGGTRLLTVSALPQPEALHTALCSGGGQRFAVKFERRQAEGQGSNGRQWANNFDQLAGDVFAVLQGKLDSGATCFLASDALLSSAAVLPAKPEAKSSECGAGVRGRIAASRNRDVVHCWPIASLPEGRRLVMAEFVRRDRDALASLVLMDRDRLVFDDYAVTYREDGADLWRVDDGGVLDVRGFQVVFLLQRGAIYTLGVNWPGTEGAALSVLVSDDRGRFTPVIADYWYQAPL